MGACQPTAMGACRPGRLVLLLAAAACLLPCRAMGADAGGETPTVLASAGTAAPGVEWLWRRGALTAGGDLAHAEMTLDEAETACASMEDCAGFTFQGNKTEKPVWVYLKRHARLNVNDPEWNSVLKWEASPSIIAHAGNATQPVNPLYMGCHSDSGYTHQPRGFYSQMVYCESFEGDHPTCGWAQTQSGTAQGSAGPDPTQAFHGVGSWKMEFSGGEGAVGAANRGLGREGLFIEAGKPYEGYLFARAPAPAGQSLRVSLRDHRTNATLATETLPVPGGGGWHRLAFELLPSAGAACEGIVPGSDPSVQCGDMGMQEGHVCIRCAGELAVELAEAGEVNVDYVYLQPGEWGRFAGLPVLASAARVLREMGVTAIRQGGSYACMPDDGEYYQWQKWTGPPYLRNSTGDWWRASLLSGWGPFEMVDFTNAAGIEPIITTTASTSPEGFADLLEYCWGGTATKWGRRRAKDGHPAPYRVKYIELGNEEYNKNFVDQVKAMEERASALGMENFFHYIFPDGLGLNDQDAARAVAEGLPVNRIVADIHTGGDGGVGAAEYLFKLRPEFSQRAMNLETNAGNHTVARALMEAADLNDFLGHGMPRLIARASSFCMERSGHYDAFDQGMSFFLPNMTWLQPPGFVHQMIAGAWAPESVPASASRFDLSVSAGIRPSTSGFSTLVVRIVNSGEGPVSVRLSVPGASVAPTAKVSTLSGPRDAGNTPSDPNRISPKKRRVTGLTPDGGVLALPGLSFSVVELTLLPGTGALAYPPSGGVLHLPGDWARGLRGDEQ